MSAQEKDFSDEIQQLGNELQLVVEEWQASMTHDMREMMAKLMRNNGPSGSSSAESRSAVRASPRGAEPTALRGNGAEDSAAEKGQPDQPRGAGEWGSYTGGELGVGYDMPLSRLLAPKIPLPHNLVGKSPNSLPGPETPGTTRKE